MDLLIHHHQNNNKKKSKFETKIVKVNCQPSDCFVLLVFCVAMISLLPRLPVQSTPFRPPKK